MENQKRIKILIAEDVESNFLYLQAVLNKIDAEVLWAQNGTESIEICSQMKNIDIVLMDVQMPILDGYEATKILKQKFPKMPIIA